MQIKTYTGTSSTALLAAIKADLGPDAVILDTRESKEDGKNQITMTVALERGEAAGMAASPESADARNAVPPGWRQWQEEWGVIKHHLISLMKPELRFEELTPRQRLALEFLEKEGVDDEMLLAFYHRLRSDPGVSILTPLEELVPVRGWGPENWPQKVHCLAGPYGVGKTTVAIRLALALRKLCPGARLCMLNADAERGGGRLLLKNYAELSDIDYREAGSRAACASVFAEAQVRAFDYIIMDLPALGREKTLPGLLAELGLDDVACAVHVVLSPQFSASQFCTMRERYLPRTEGPRREGSLVWTKLDESDHYGSLVNMGARLRLPVSALSFGPGLRNTLIPARDAALWRLIFKRELPQAG